MLLALTLLVITIITIIGVLVITLLSSQPRSYILSDIESNADSPDLSSTTNTGFQPGPRPKPQTIPDTSQPHLPYYTYYTSFFTRDPVTAGHQTGIVPSTSDSSYTSIRISPSHPAIFGHGLSESGVGADEAVVLRVMVTPPTPAKARARPGVMTERPPRRVSVSARARARESRRGSLIEEYRDESGSESESK